MAKISGMKVKLFIKEAATGNVLAGQRNATLNRSAETIDATSKDTEGNWTESIPGFKSWSIDSDGAFVVDDVAYETLEMAYLNGENVDVYLELPSGNKYEGNATITDFPIEAPYDDVVTYSVSLQGNGKLSKVLAGSTSA